MTGKYPQALEELMELLRSLPGVGRRSAERMAFSLYSWDGEKLEALSANLHTLKQRVGKCPRCGNLSGDDHADGLCPICASPVRDASVVCVVEEAAQIRNIESSGVFKGVYHVLGGRIAPLEGRGIDSIDVEGLEKRIGEGTIREVILALSPDVEGQATAIYLANRLKERGVKISAFPRSGGKGTYLRSAHRHGVSERHISFLPV